MATPAAIPDPRSMPAFVDLAMDWVAAHRQATGHTVSLGYEVASREVTISCASCSPERAGQ